MEKQLFSRQEIAEILGISRAMVDKLIGLRQLKPTKIGRRTLFNIKEINRISKNGIFLRWKKPAKDTREKKLAI